jgi:asparagine synthase (glutamine-hydrolysing)
MTETLVHRGPDDGGVWIDEKAGVALGHRRLSILDLSPLGHQPMASASGRFVMVFNGEVYNYSDVRRELESRGITDYRGTSDTEVMLAAFEEWGLAGALGRFNGMFAIALWDTHERLLHLCVDRLGEKPLYYGHSRGVFLFGSELKALRAHPAFAGEIDRDALALYFRHGYIPGPWCIYQGISKLEPGTYRTARPGGEISSPVAYWSARDAAEAGCAHLFTGTPAEAINGLDLLLTDSVRSRMVADVPLGAFLSGGIDSSAIVALMQKSSSRPVRTFTVGFGEDRYNEAVFAGEVARHLGTDHTELYVTEGDALRVIPKLPRMYDEPFADSSQIPTFLISQLARSYVTVALSGDGGDELFGGYTRYSWAEKVWDRFGWMPAALRRIGSKALDVVPSGAWDELASLLSGVIPLINQRHLGDKMGRLSAMLNAEDAVGIYRSLVSDWQDSESLVPGAVPRPTPLDKNGYSAKLSDFRQIMMLLDSVTYLPGDILAKVDRASMAVSLESRVPLLDHRVYEFAWTLPLSMKVREGKAKWILRQVLYKYVPARLVERPKSGFAIPLDTWLRGPLRDWAEELLDEKRLSREGYLKPEPIRRTWHEHLSGKHNRAPLLWDVLMFQSWLESHQEVSNRDPAGETASHAR